MITVKDYFAGLAMQELMRQRHDSGTVGGNYDMLSKEAFKWAEAMERARAGK